MVPSESAAHSARPRATRSGGYALPSGLRSRLQAQPFSERANSVRATQVLSQVPQLHLVARSGGKQPIDREHL